MTLLLDIAPPVALPLNSPATGTPLTPTRVPPLTAPGAAPSPLTGYTAWVLYQPDDRRQGLADALADSVSDHTARYGAPTALLCHPANVDALGTVTGLLVCLPQPGGVTPDRGTWGLA